MKIVAIVGMSIALMGCSTGSLGPTKLPNGAYAGMWSEKDPSAVQACLDQGGFGAGYQAQPVKKSESDVYHTVVVVTTQEVPTPTQVAAYGHCLLKDHPS